MTDRRASRRYVFTPPFSGRARAMVDCVIEHWDGERGIVHGAHAAVPGDTLVIQFNSQAGELRSHTVRVMSSVPNFDSGTPRFTLVVSVMPEAPDGSGVSPHGR